EDGIRDRNVTGVQTCALPICGASRAVQIAPTEVEALQRKLDAVEHRLAHDTLVLEPPAAVGRFTAMALGIVVVFVEGLLSLGLKIGRASCRERGWSWAAGPSV